MKYSIIPRSTVCRSHSVTRSLPVSLSHTVSHLSADVIVLNSLYSHNYNLTKVSSLSCGRASHQIDLCQVLLQSPSIIARKCIIKLTQSQPPRPSPNSLSHGLPVHLSTGLTTASNFISECIPSRSLIATPISLEHGLKVHLPSRTITASQCIFQLALARPASTSRSSLDLGLHLHLLTRSITASESNS
jgi:hypothetical protein